MDTKYRKFSVALEEGCPVLTVLYLSDFCSLPWLVNCCTHSLQESPEGRKQSLLLIGNRILFHRWSSAIISPCLGVRQARRVRFNLETKTFILPVHYFSLIISYVSETNIRDHIVPWISIQCIFKRHVTHTHTKRMYTLLKTPSQQNDTSQKATGHGPRYPKSTPPSGTPTFVPSAAFHTASDPPWFSC